MGSIFCPCFLLLDDCFCFWVTPAFSQEVTSDSFNISFILSSFVFMGEIFVVDWYDNGLCKYPSSLELHMRILAMDLIMEMSISNPYACDNALV